MESYGAQSGVVGVGKAVDDSMERISAYYIIIIFYASQLDKARGDNSEDCLLADSINAA